MEQRSAGRTDIELGKLIRLRRVEQKVSAGGARRKNSALALTGAKYEKGANRVGAALLQQIAAALDVPSHSFTTKSREVESHS